MNNKIDFYEKKKALHEEMVDAIKELLHMNGLDELDLSNGCDTGYVTIVDDCLYPPTEVEVKRVFLDEHSNLMADVEFDYDNCINLEDVNNVMLCSFDTVYESVYELIHKNEVPDCKHYHLGFCHFYMGGMCNGIEECHVKKGEADFDNEDFNRVLDQLEAKKNHEVHRARFDAEQRFQSMLKPYKARRAKALNTEGIEIGDIITDKDVIIKVEEINYIHERRGQSFLEFRGLRYTKAGKPRKDGDRFFCQQRYGIVPKIVKKGGSK